MRSELLIFTFHCQKLQWHRLLGNKYCDPEHLLGHNFVKGRRAKSPADFVSKNEGSLGELEETLYWLELLSRSRHY